jgi:hypothetical protein
MYAAMLEINVAIVLLMVSAALFVWFQSSLTAASARRVAAMRTRLGPRPAPDGRDDPQTRAVMKSVRRRCGNCRVEDYCERWLAREAQGDSAFCRNAAALRNLA